MIPSRITWRLNLRNALSIDSPWFTVTNAIICPFATAALLALITRMNHSTDPIREKYVHLLRLDQRDHLTFAVRRMIDSLPYSVSVGPVVRLRRFTGRALTRADGPIFASSSLSPH